MDVDGEFLTKLREAMLQSVADNPIHPWPGPPPGMEGKASSSRMGEHACMRQKYLELVNQLEPGTYEVLARTGEQEVAPQRGWILEDSLRHWLGNANLGDITVGIRHFDNAVLGPGARYFGHPDDWVEFIIKKDGKLFAKRILLEYKHMRAMSYREFLTRGVQATEPLYYAQAQSMLACDEVKKLGITSCLFVITPFDVSGVKGSITMGKRAKRYAGELEPDFRTVPDCSGVHPVFYFELVPSLPTYQRALLAWCRELDKHVEDRTMPPRKYDVGKRGVWQCDYCELRYACEEGGSCVGGCEHTFCADQDFPHLSDDAESCLEVSEAVKDAADQAIRAGH